MKAMTISLPMCSIDFMDTSLSPEEQMISDRITELKQKLGDDLLILGHHYQSLNDSARDVHKVVNKIKTEFFDLDLSAENVIKRLDLALKDVQKLQTRVNVLGNKLEKGAESLEEEN